MNKPPYKPTQARIAKETAKIRKGWEAEKRNRATRADWRVVPAEIMVIDCQAPRKMKQELPD